jgi:hypothetical protein
MKGTIKRINDVQQVSDKFKKQELILVVQDGKYDQTICIEFQQDNCSMLDSFGDGQEVVVEINIRGREWTNPKDNTIRVFNTLVGWKITASGPATATEQSAEKMGDDSDTDDDLPF